MGRTVNTKRTPPHPKPVEKVELSEKHLKRRLVLTILFILVGAGAIAYGFMQFLSGDDDAGWTQMEANATSDELSCSEDFVFLYELGAGDTSSLAENKALKIIYTQLAVDAYKVFDADYTYDEVGNVCSINRSPNEIVTVEPALYEALETVQEYGDRSIYLGPVYQMYDSLFFCEDDSQTADYDPYQNSYLMEYYGEIAAYACDSESVDIELLGENQVRLTVSEEYLAYAEENGITDYIDFSWMTNAFITDYLADSLIESGYTHGCITSYDGFVRNLDDRDVSYSFAIYSRDGNEVDQPAILQYTGTHSIVYLRNYMMSEKDAYHYYEMDDGEIRTIYLDTADGLCKSAVNDLVSYSEEKSCAEVLLSVRDIYIAEELDTEALDVLAGESVYSVYVMDGELLYNEPELEEEIGEDGTKYLVH
ncbi:MAG: hypothetical protein LUC83_10765 [Clostridiales bacterium]|nr:hypothetical protein [Clostridiales bacterium]